MKNGWQTKRLGDVAEVSAGNSAPQNESLFTDGTYPFFRTADAGRVRFGDIYESEDYLNEKGIKGLRRYPKGTILFPKSGASTFLNHRVMLGVEGCVSSHLATIVADEVQVEPRFLLYFLSTIKAQDLVQDHAYPSLNLPTISGINIQAPPVPEQQRIIGLLDESFAGIATAKANAEKNLQSARALFESHLHSFFTRRRKDWSEKQLGEVCEYVNGKAHEQCIDKDGRFIVVNSKFISTEGEVLKRSNDALLFLQPGDVAMVLSDVPNGKALAKCFLVAKADTYTLNQRICLVRSANFHTKFLFYQLNRNKHFLSFDNGENQTNLRLNQVLSCPLFLPPLAEQKTIAGELDAMSEETRRLASLYERKLVALEALKKSLLHQAFSGEL
jgi:type I restriction enzyme, S subunit